MSILARALAYQDAICDPAVGNRAGLARRLGVSRAFVTQAMAVLVAPAPVVAAIRRAEAQGRPVTEGLWRRIRSLSASEAVSSILDGTQRE